MKEFFVFLIFVVPFAAVFLGVTIALYWPKRFSLRGMLVCMTFLSVVMGLIAWLARR